MHKIISEVTSLRGWLGQSLSHGNIIIFVPVSQRNTLNTVNIINEIGIGCIGSVDWIRTRALTNALWN
jgi:hypothetical protein